MYRKNMDENDPRKLLDQLIRNNGDRYAAISKLLGRNAAYVQQFIKRGTPKKLDEEDRQILAEYYGVDQQTLGAPDKFAKPTKRTRGMGLEKIGDLIKIPKLAVGASAGAGALTGSELPIDEMAFGEKWLRRLCHDPSQLSLIAVTGDSMSPTLSDGDDIMVDRSAATTPLRDSIYVLRMDDALMVKRLAIAPDRSLSVISDNPQFRDWDNVDPANIDVIGRVVWTGRKL